MSLADTGRNLVEEAKRLPWWGWLLLAAGVYFGYQFISSMGGSSASSPDASSGATSGDSGSPLIPPIYAPGNDPGTDGSSAPAEDPIPDLVDTKGQQTAGPSSAPSLSSNASAKERTPELRDTSATATKVPANWIAQQKAQQQQVSVGQKRFAAQQARTGSGGGPDSAAAYTVRPGDTLSSIADMHGTDHETLYTHNAAVIESSARSRGLAHSDGGTWLAPGTRLEIPR